jgi:site-specific DNA-methyltransferase (adenine-specific)
VSRYTIHTGDCREVLRDYPDNHFDSIVTDPPYGLTFMGKGWDKGVPGEEFWREILRVAKPGAHLLAFGGTRTFHRLTCAIEDAGWEIRDCVMWVYGSGFPKSHDVGKAIDREAGAERKVVGTKRGVQGENINDIVRGGAVRQIGEAGASGVGAYGTGVKQVTVDIPVTAPATDEAKQWQGWGTALKPAWEPIIVARKPLEGTVAATVLQYGTGALNIDGCRVGTDDTRGVASATALGQGSGWNKHNNKPVLAGSACGRWPANLITDGSDEVVAGFPESKSTLDTSNHAGREGTSTFAGSKQVERVQRGDSGSAARFFYCAKASVADREEGLDHLPDGTLAYSNGAQAAESDGADEYTGGSQNIGLNNLKRRKNTHPTVKPTDLMRYCVRLVTQPGGLVLDPFCGSGSTGKAAMLEGARFVGIDLDANHTRIAEARCEHAAPKESDKPLTDAPAVCNEQLPLFNAE